MKVKIGEIKDAALDWVVAWAAGFQTIAINDSRVFVVFPNTSQFTLFSPSSDKEQGEVIARTRKININYCHDPRDKGRLYIHAKTDDDIYHGYWFGDHKQPLIAAMRCFAISHFGDEIEVPDTFL